MVLGSSPDTVTSPSDFAPASSKEFLDIQATVECGFTLKRVRDMTRTYSTLASFDIKWFHLNFNYCKLFSNLKLILNRNLTLFSVLLHFLRCVRSCDTVKEFPSYCPLCSRVENFWQDFEGFFEDLKISTDDKLVLGSKNCNIDLEVFMSKSNDYFKFYRIKNEFCTYFQEFRYVDEMFTTFSSIFIRMYLNFSTLVFEQSFYNLRKADQYKIRHIIASEGIFLIGRFWHETNVNYFFELFDKFVQFNKSNCFRNSLNKPEFGLYYLSAFDITLSFSQH